MAMGIILWAVGWGINLHADGRLRQLRRKGGGGILLLFISKAFAALRSPLDISLGNRDGVNSQSVGLLQAIIFQEAACLNTFLQRITLERLWSGLAGPWHAHPCLPVPLRS